jgi:DNA repair ATPase RecN
VLRELRIENLLLIERAELRLDEGLNAITGETGAGKTVLAHALDLLMGGKARPQIVRPGAGEGPGVPAERRTDSGMEEGVAHVGPVGLEPTTHGLKVHCSAN